MSTIGSKAAEVFNNLDVAKTAKPKGTGSTILRYPLDLDQDSLNYIRFEIVDRATQLDQKSIYLYTPPGFSVPDGATYNQADLGIVGGATEAAAETASGEREIGSAQNAKDLAGAVIQKAISKGGTIGQAALIQGGQASNPYTNVAFQGTVLRSFNFPFKLVAESEDEAEQVRLIENTFRKFLYPDVGDTEFLLKYPPLFKIEFVTKVGDDMLRNKFMPFINYCYLLNMTTTFNESTNIFHTSGQPTEVSLSLTFQESKAMIRKDLYADPDNFNTADYHGQYDSPVNIPPVQDGE